jgi:hypothetical protein
MKQFGNGLAGMDKIWQIALDFERYGDPLTEEEARKLIVNCVNDFLTAVNNNQQLKPLLRDYPFTANNIDLTIFNYDKNRSLYQYPSIAIVNASKGKVSFFTKHESIKYGYHTEKYETYDEAIAILKKQNKIDHSNEPAEGAVEKPPQDNKNDL